MPATPEVPTPGSDRLAQLPVHTADVAGFIGEALAAGSGLLHLAPCWVPRSFLRPGRRLRLHPDDLYPFGVARGGIDERWLSSTVTADNDGRQPDEGLSYVIAAGQRVTLQEAIAAGGADLLGAGLWQAYGRWPVFAKLFDNAGPIPHHMHQSDAQVAALGRVGKPEAYYFPPQYNAQPNDFPYTFFGLNPSTRPSDVRDCLARWHEGDNGILGLSPAYRLEVGTGWLVDPRILHAPGSLCTFEPQWASDVFAMFQSVLDGQPIPWSLLVKDMPPEHHDDLDFIVAALDWEKNVDPTFVARHFLRPRIASASPDHVDRWVVYGRIDGQQCFTARELTIAPGGQATVVEPGCHGLLCTQGAGRVNGQPLAAPTMIRFGQLTRDEYFVGAPAATAGVHYENHSDVEPLVVLRYYGPEADPGAPEAGEA